MPAAVAVLARHAHTEAGCPAGARTRVHELLAAQAEAELCVGMLANLRAQLTAHAVALQREGRSLPGPVSVGFIAFYRAQVACLRRTLQQALPEAADQV